MTRAASAPAFLAYRVRTIASFVLFDPVPAITGTRPSAARITRSITRSCSSYESVADSPVVPHGTMPSVPFRIWNSTSRRNAAASTFPSRNGVTVATIAPWNIRTPLSVPVGLLEDPPVARPRRVPLEVHLAEILPPRIEVDREPLASAGPHGNRRGDEAVDRGEDAGGHRAGAARQGFRLHTAFVRTQPEHAVPELGEVDVRPAGGERLVGAYAAPDARHVRLRHVRHEQDRVGHAGVQERVGVPPPPQRQGPVDRKSRRPGHLELDAAPPHRGVDDPGDRLEGGLAPRDTARGGVPRRATAAVPAHLGAGAVGVVEVPAEVGLPGRLDEDHAVRPDRAGAVAHPGGEGGAVDPVHHPAPVVDQQEVVAAAVQLGKGDSLPHHRAVRIAGYRSIVPDAPRAGQSRVTSSPSRGAGGTTRSAPRGRRPGSSRAPARPRTGSRTPSPPPRAAACCSWRTWKTRTPPRS